MVEETPLPYRRIGRVVEGEHIGVVKRSSALRRGCPASTLRSNTRWVKWL